MSANLQVSAPPTPSSTTLDWPAPDSFIDVGHSQVAYRVFGEGPDLLFVHGWPLHGATFRAIIEVLRRQYRCHVIDLPGCGDSQWDDRSLISLAHHCDTVERVIKHLELSRYVMIGHDSGAAITRIVAARLADSQWHNVGLVAGNTEIPDHIPLLVKMMMVAAKTPLAAPSFRALLGSRKLRRSKLGFGGCFTDLDFVDGVFSDLFVTPLIEDSTALAGQLRLVRDFDFETLDDLEAVHHALPAPTLLIWGAQDTFFPLPLAREMLPQFSAGVQLEVIDPGGLFAHEEYPGQFLEHTEPFLQRCFAACS